MAKSTSRGSVRMGPLSLFALTTLLCLAVLAVLAVTTAQTSFISAEKQASFTTDGYKNETQAQIFLAFTDSHLSRTRNDGHDRYYALSALSDILPENAWIDDNVIHAEFSQESGRTLRITLLINDDVTYRITQWQATTTWSSESGGIVWQGTPFQSEEQ